MRDLVALARREYKIVSALVVLVAAIMLVVVGYEGYARYLVSGFSLLVAATLLVGMVRDIARGHYGVDILAVTAIVSTVWVGEYWASIIIVLMMLGGEALETFASARAKAELTALMERAPTIAHKQMVDGSTHDVPIANLKRNDVFVVRPGEVIPVDAVVVTGRSSLDESSLTGESLPVDVEPGDEVMSGALNGQSPLVLQALRVASDSQYSKIVELVKEATEAQAPFVRLADRYAAPFTLAAFAIGGVAWALSGEPRRFAEVLVLATPCPLLIAAPVAFISGMSRAAKNGVIIKNGGIIERLATVRAAAFDKTGTLTTGKLSVEGVVVANGIDEDELLRLAYTIEQHSGHPTALAIIEEAKKRKLKLGIASKTREVAGGGIVATIERRVTLAGKRSFLVKHGVSDDTIPDLGKMTTHFARSKKYIGSITYSDTIRNDARATLRSLESLGVNRFVMLTGDQRAAADAIAKKLGITDVHAECLPVNKLDIMQKFEERPIMMVGDGVNDAPVLAASDVGIAMGARGATAASESADVVVMLDELKRVPYAVSIAQRTLSVAKQSVWIGIAISVVLMLIATTGAIPAVAGALLQEVVDVAVILYALRAHSGQLPQIREQSAMV